MRLFYDIFDIKREVEEEQEEEQLLLGSILLMVVGMLISGGAALQVRSSCSKYSKQMSPSGLTGAQRARIILDCNNLSGGGSSRWLDSLPL